jgi:hypothetical protein
MKRGRRERPTRRATMWPEPMRTLPTLPAASWPTSFSASLSANRAFSTGLQRCRPLLSLASTGCSSVRGQPEFANPPLASLESSPCWSLDPSVPVPRPRQQAVTAFGSATTVGARPDCQCV